jgi:ABC-type glycerol-3-phosphate transport system substrate-binding protein
MRRTALLILTLLIVLFVGCRAPEDGKTRVRVTFWGSPEEVKIITDTIHEWERDHPDIVVILEHANYPNYCEKILTQVAGNSGPDVIFSDIPYFFTFEAHDMFLDLTPYVNRTKPPLTERFFPEIMKPFTRHGKIYCIPRDIAPITCIYYNKKLFDQAGIPYPTDDWDWDKFLYICRKLTVREGERVTRYGFYGWEWANFVYSNGGRLVDSEEYPTKCVLDTPEARRGLQFYHDLIYKEKVMPSPQQIAASGMNTAQYFANEVTAMYLTGIWETPQLRTLDEKAKEQGKDFKWDIVQFPKSPGGKRGTRTGGSGYAILRTTKHPEAAWEVVKALAGAKGQSDLARTGLAQPADRTIAESEVWAGTNNIPPNRKTLNDAVKYVVFDPSHPKWPYFQNNIVNRQMELYLINRQDLDTTIRNITTELNAVLRKNPVQR